MKFLIICLLLLTANLANARNKPAISYAFAYDTSARQLDVTVRFHGSTTGKTVIHLPDQWAGQEKLYRAVKTISVTGKNAVFEPISDSSRRTILHKPGAKLEIRYRLVQDWSGELVYPNNFRGVLDSRYFQFTGRSLLIVPGYGNAPVTFSLDFSRLPASWKVMNSFSAGRKYTGVVLAPDLLNSVFVAGDFRTYQTSVEGKPVHVAIRGDKWEFSDSLLVDRVKVIVAMERKFWKDFSEDYYCVTLIPFDDSGSANGTSLHHAFMLAMGYDQLLQDWLLTHEYFHRWNGTTMRLYEETEQEHSWFTEGFTEYYSYKLLYENELIGKRGFVKSVNEMIAAYYLSPVRNVDRLTQGKNYWGGRDFQNIPYKKGFVYALWLDHTIRSRGSHTLDDLMFAMNAIQTKKDSIPYPVFLEIASRFAGDISEFQEKYIDRGETIPILPGSLGEDFLLVEKELGTFDAGFDIEATLESDVITGVREGSAAWKAGLRNGQKPLSYSIYRGNASYPVEILLSENGVERTISFLPMSDEKVVVPQFEVRE